MRFSRWLILIAILSIVAYVGQSYIKRKQVLAKDTPAPPAPLGTGIEGRANDWVYTQSDGEHPRVTVRAHSFRQIKAPSVMELEGVELQLFHKAGDQFDLVKSASAQFDMAAKTLYSDGDVEISMGKGVSDETGGRVLKIHSSGVRFASDTGKASTDRMATFEFDQGSGSAEGVDYDPQTRELHLRGHVSMDWKGRDPKGQNADSKLMHIEAGEAYYREAESNVTLLPWSKLTRDTLRMEGGASLVKLEKGVIKEADSQAAHGVQEQPGRKVEFGADHLIMRFGDRMIVTTIKGEGNGKLVSTANATQTTITGDKLDLDFDPMAKESTLLRAVATGKSIAEAQPLPRAGVPLQDTRILRSEVVRLTMRPGGRDIDKVITDGAGTVDFLPNRTGQPKRNVQGDHMEFIYGPENRLQHFGANNAVTRTEHPDRPSAPPLLTQSKEIGANFDPKTGDLALLAQKGDFHYQEGTRQATANLATLDPSTDLMALDGAARAWDPTGSASADRLTMNQKTGDFTADGHVATTHIPDNKDSSGSGSTVMLSNAEVMQGRAQHMTSAQHNQKLHYEGNAVVWQGANRVEADRIDIDRATQMFEAQGKVVSQFIDKTKDKDEDRKKPKGPKTAPQAPPIFTVVRAPDLQYSGETRIAHYWGGVSMVRPGLTVTAKELRAYLNDSGSDTSLDKAFGDGAVKIVSTADKRTRTGTSEHAEYYANEQKVILENGDPLLVDSLKGQTRGKQLTWWANNDRLLVNGVEDRHVDSLLRKK
jgi:lipopolysaccharide export system protein LptA